MTDLNPVDAMTTDYRALCAELVDSVELLLEMRAVDAKPMAITEDRLTRARALLDQPEPKGPTDEELLRVAATAIEPYENSGIPLGEYCEYVGVSAPIEPYGSYIYLRASHTHWLPANALPTPESQP